MGELDKALTLAEEALEVSRSIGNLWGQGVSLFTIGPIHLERGEVDKGIKAMEDSLPLVEQAEFVIGTLLVPAIMSWVYGTLGDVERGFELARAALAQANEPNIGRVDKVRQLALAALAYLHLLSGNHVEADSAYKQAYGEDGEAEFEPEPGYMGLFVIFHGMIQSELSLAKNEYDHVLTSTTSTVALMQERRMRAFLPDMLRLKGLALIRLGRTDEARHVLAQARDEAEAMDSRRSLWPILSALSQLEAQRGDPTAAESLRQEAHAVIDYIAEHIGSPELRASFLATKSVREVLTENISL